MRTSQETNQLNHSAWMTLRSWQDSGWVAAVSDTTRIIEQAEPATSKEETEQKVSYVAEFAGKVIANLDEPVVYHYHEEQYDKFLAVIPEPNEPFDIYGVSDSRDKPTLFVNFRQKPISQFSSTNKMAAAREIVVSKRESGTNVWMGAGVRTPAATPGYAFENMPEGAHLVVGNAEIADLFDTLRSKTDETYNAKLFGGLFHIAWLADDFDVALPFVPVFSHEGQQALVVNAKQLILTDNAINSYRHFAQMTQEMSDNITEIPASKPIHTDTDVNTETFVAPLWRPNDIQREPLGSYKPSFYAEIQRLNKLASDQYALKEKILRQARIISTLTGITA